MHPSSAYSRQSDNDSRQGQTVQLPRIQSGNSIKRGGTAQQEDDGQFLLEGQPVDNPFFIPEDYEIFKMKEKEKEIRRQERVKNSNLKIWEKGIKSKGAFTVGRLNELCKIDEEQEENYQKLNIVDAAKSAIKNRVRQKEPMHQFLDKKREMLLFQMLIDHKREQINQFEELTRLHRRGLEKSEQMLEDDLNAFNNFLEENKNKSRQTIKDAEDENKRKQDRINEVKQLQELKAELTTKNTQKIESLEEMLRYKNFLDQITPKDQLEKINMKKQSKRQNKTRKHRKTQQSQNQDTEKYQMNISPEIQQLLDDSDEDFETYFEKPQQLEAIFTDLEEKNLNLIFNTKETEQKVEEIKKDFEEKKERLNQVKKTLLAQKQDQLKQLEQINEQIRHLKLVKGDNEPQKQLESLESEIFKIYKNEFRHDKGADVRKDLQGIEMLKEMENALEKIITEVRVQSQKDLALHNLISEKEKFFKKNKKLNNDPARQEQEIQQYLENQQKIQKERREKRYGRPIMAKSMLQKQEKREQEEIEISDDSLDNSRYFS